MTKEHLWPDWLRKIILQSRGGGGGKKFAAEFERNGETKRFTTIDLETRVSMPCKGCNERWMNDLENMVKPFVAQMAFPGTVTILNLHRKVALAQWFTKIAMVCDFTGDARYFTQEERAAFKETRAIPRNVWIWAGRYDDPRPIHGLERRGTETDLVKPCVYTLTVALGFLVLQILSYRGSAGQFGQYAAATRQNVLMHVFLPIPEQQSWPPERTIDDEELLLLDDRFVEIARRR